MDKDVIYSDVSMKKYNTWRVGGLAEYYVEISSEAALQKIFSINKLQKPITVIGVGSNLLIRDGGIKGTVINLSRGLKNIFLDHHLIFAECGISCSSLARFSAKNNKKNCAFLAGIPGNCQRQRIFTLFASDWADLCTSWKHKIRSMIWVKSILF